MPEIIRTGVFYDGSFFAHVSDHYRYHHRRGTRISLTGLHDFIRDEIVKLEEGDKGQSAALCSIVEAHYFRSRFAAEDAEKHDALLRDRRFEDVLIRAGITPHFLLMPPSRDDAVGGSPSREKGIDVWLALEAFELAWRRQLDVVVLVTGDADFLPLVRKLNAIGKRTMLMGWDLLSSVDGSRTRTAQVLLDAATHMILMNQEIDGRSSNSESKKIDNLFMSPGSVDLAGIQQSRDVLRQQGSPGPQQASAVDDRSASLDASRAAKAHGQTPEPASFATGVIDNLVYDKGFGFIRPESGGDNYFFHASDVELCEFADLRLEDAVRFVVAPNPKDGRPAARRVTRLPAISNA